MPKFQKGQSGNPKGRPRGARIKPNAAIALNVYKICNNKEFCPFTQLVEIAKHSEDKLLQFNATKELAQYLVPKLRAVTVSGDAANPVSFSLHTGNSPQEVNTIDDPGGGHAENTL